MRDGVDSMTRLHIVNIDIINAAAVFDRIVSDLIVSVHAVSERDDRREGIEPKPRFERGVVGVKLPGASAAF